MSKYFFCIVFISFSFCAFAQFSFGVKSGMNINYLLIKESPQGLEIKPDHNLGYHIGVYGKIKMINKLFFITEVQFIKKGFNDDLNNRIVFNYVELPLLISYNPVKIISIELGPNVGYMASAAAKKDGSRTSIKSYKDFDFGFIGGLRINITERIGIVGRYYYGLSSIQQAYYDDLFSKETHEFNSYNRNIQVGLSYKIK